MTDKEPRVGVWSEIGKLRRVLVCSPGLAHERLTPDTADELLYDDVLWTQQARRDHFDFVAKMEDRGVEVLQLDLLLEDIMADPEARSWVLDRKITPDLVGTGISKEVRPWLDEAGAAAVMLRRGSLVPDDGEHTHEAERTAQETWDWLTTVGGP